MDQEISDLPCWRASPRSWIRACCGRKTVRVASLAT